MVIHPSTPPSLSAPLNPSSSRNSIPPPHALLLLSDSALPLGSFAFSSGLESYLAHSPPTANYPSTTLPHYLSLSLTSLATTTLPHLLATHTTPSLLPSLADTLDASTLCPVARRASLAQGRALLTLWDRALKQSSPATEASAAIAAFAAALRNSPATGGAPTDPTPPAAHYPAIYAAVSAAMGIPLAHTAYTYLFSHAKAVVSAGVRASVVGPYAAQGILGGAWLRGEIEACLRRNWARGVEEAGQGVVMVDLWVGRHELLYSRIFNS